MTFEEIAVEQRRILGDEMIELMSAAAEAQEMFSLDELEEFAKECK